MFTVHRCLPLCFSVSRVSWFCLCVYLIISLRRLIENNDCGVMSVSHTTNQALPKTLLMLNSGLRPSFNITQCSQLGLVWGMGHSYITVKKWSQFCTRTIRNGFQGYSFVGLVSYCNPNCKFQSQMTP